MSRSLSLDGSTSYMSVAKKLRAANLDDNAFTHDGTLSMRLDTTKCHLSDNENGYTMCLFYRLLGVETQRGIDSCETCNINLYKSCYI